MTDLVRIPNPAAGENDSRRDQPERNAEIYRLRVVNRWTLQQIADQFGISNQRVHAIVEQIRKDLPALDLAALRQESLDLHHHTQKVAMELAEREGTPVTAGKDGNLVYDPTTNAVVRDYSLRLAALNLALKADAEIRKLHGLDAAQKIEQTGSVRYEVVGVDLGKLS